MKEHFSYTLPLKQKQEITETLPNGDKITKSVDKESLVKIIIKEPSRKEIQEAKDVYNREWSRCVTNGIVTRAILDKKYRAENGIFTPSEIKNLEDTQKRIKEIREEYSVLDKIPNKSVEDNEKINDLLNEFSNIQKGLDELENLNEDLYSNTAESISKQKEIMYNILYLSYIEERGRPVPLIDGDSLEDKLENYDVILDKNDEKSKLYYKIIERNGYFVNMLSRGKLEVSQLDALNKQWNEIDAKAATDDNKAESDNKVESDKKAESDKKEEVKSTQESAAVVPSDINPVTIIKD